MTRNWMRNALGVAVFVFLVSPFQAEALSEAQMQSVSGLLRSFGVSNSLMEKVRLVLTGEVLGTSTTDAIPAYCPTLTVTLQRGSRDTTTGGQVSELQRFLSGYYDIPQNELVTGFFGIITEQWVKDFQIGNGLPSVGIVGVATRAKIAEVCQGDVTPPPPPPPSTVNRNLGTLKIRAIVVTLAEVSNKFGSYGMTFTQTKLPETDQALQRLNTFIKQSSYGQTQLQWSTSGVYDIGTTCTADSYDTWVKQLKQRALERADAESPLEDYSMFLIVNPVPDCSGYATTYGGDGQFTEFVIHGKTLHLRGVHTADLSDYILFHEFGHSLGYNADAGGLVGHVGYTTCHPVLVSGVKVLDFSQCTQVFNEMFDGVIHGTPIFDIMGHARNYLSDFSSFNKEAIGWLQSSQIVTTQSGQYTLSPLEQIAPSPKVLKIPILNTNYVVNVSFRQPVGYTYPAAPQDKPNGVILDVTYPPFTRNFLVTDSINWDAPLTIGVPYRLGTSGPYVTVTGIQNNVASVSVSSSITPPPPPSSQPVITTYSASPSSVSLGQSSTLTWTTTGTTDGGCHIYLGSSWVNVNAVGLSGNSTFVVTPLVTTSYRLWCTSSWKDGSTFTEKTITVNVTTPPTPTAPVINSFIASPTTISSGQSSTLTWNTAGTLNGGCYLFAGSAPTTSGMTITPSSLWVGSGSFAVTPSSTTVYTLWCVSSWVGNSLATQRSVTVTVSAATTPIVAPRPEPTPVDRNSQ